MYVVLSGEKTFTLLPPSDAAFLPQLLCPTLRHTINDVDKHNVTDNVGHKHNHDCYKRLKKADLGTAMSACPAERLSWIPIDVDAPGAEQRHAELFSHIRPLRCTVKAGETLYIPAMWYHQVSQTRLTISINFWYEMKFDFRYERCAGSSQQTQCVLL